MKNAILATVLVFAASAMANEATPAPVKADSQPTASAPSASAPEASKEKEMPAKAPKAHGKKAKKEKGN